MIVAGVGWNLQREGEGSLAFFGLSSLFLLIPPNKHGLEDAFAGVRGALGA